MCRRVWPGVGWEVGVGGEGRTRVYVWERVCFVRWWGRGHAGTVQSLTAARAPATSMSWCHACHVCDVCGVCHVGQTCLGGWGWEGTHVWRAPMCTGVHGCAWCVRCAWCVWCAWCVVRGAGDRQRPRPANPPVGAPFATSPTHPRRAHLVGALGDGVGVVGRAQRPQQRVPRLALSSPARTQRVHARACGLVRACVHACMHACTAHPAARTPA
jgi:hypothetical protein